MVQGNRGAHINSTTSKESYDGPSLPVYMNYRWMEGLASIIFNSLGEISIC